MLSDHIFLDFKNISLVYFNLGSCDYGPRCKYSHTNPELLVASKNAGTVHSVIDCPEMLTIVLIYFLKIMA